MSREHLGPWELEEAGGVQSLWRDPGPPPTLISDPGPRNCEGARFRCFKSPACGHLLWPHHRDPEAPAERALDAGFPSLLIAVGLQVCKFTVVCKCEQK